MEHKATIDSFKNAIKEFYIAGDLNDPKEFETILKSYTRDENELRKKQFEEDN